MSNLALRPDWAQLSNEWECSGIDQKTFCKQRGVSYFKFRDERGKLKRMGLAAGHSDSGNLVAASGLASPVAAGPQRMRNSVVDFLPVTVEVDESRSKAPFEGKASQACPSQPEVEVELPFGVVLRFRGVQQR